MYGYIREIESENSKIANLPFETSEKQTLKRIRNDATKRMSIERFYFADPSADTRPHEVLHMLGQLMPLMMHRYSTFTCVAKSKKISEV